MGSNFSFRVCDHCNQRIPADSVFCPQCGAALRPTRVSRKATSTGGSKNGAALWGLLGAGALLVVVLVALHHRHPNPVAQGTPSHRTTKRSQNNPGSTANKRPESGSTPSSVPKSHPHPKAPVKPKVHAKHSGAPSTKKPKGLSTPPTIQSGWSSQSVSYQGATINLTLPKSLTESISKVSSAEWRFANTGNSAYNVTVTALAPSSSPPAGTNSLGPDAYGTPISDQGKTATQTLYVDWAGHAWVKVSMVVPVQDSSWLGSIAQSVRIS